MQVLLCPLQSISLNFTSAIAKYDDFSSSGPLNAMIAAHRPSTANEGRIAQCQLVKEDCLTPLVSFSQTFNFLPLYSVLQF